MKLSKTAEKILLEAYKQANGEEFDISPKALNVSNDEFNRAVEELESGNNDKEIIYLNAIRSELESPIKAVSYREFKISPNGKEYVEKNLK